MKPETPIAWKLLISNIEFGDLLHTHENFDAAITVYLNAVGGRKDGQPVHVSQTEIMEIKEWLTDALLTLDGPVKRKAIEIIHEALAELVIDFQKENGISGKAET